MGLDMFALSVAKSDILEDNKINPVLVDEDHLSEIAYFRKFYDLHYWMETLYIKNGGTSSGDFNCVKIRLDESDLDQLEKNVDLVPVSGFFFGELRRLSSEDIEAIKNFISTCRSEIADGRVVYYDSWW